MVTPSSQRAKSSLAIFLLILTVLATLVFLYASAADTQVLVATDSARLRRLSDSVRLLEELGPEVTTNRSESIARIGSDVNRLAESKSLRALSTLKLVTSNEPALLITGWNGGSPEPDFLNVLLRLDQQFTDFSAKQAAAFTLLELGLLATLISLAAFTVFWARDEARRVKQFEELQAVYRASLAALEAERKRIALDLHDTLAQELVGAKMLVSGLPDAPGKFEGLASLDRSQVLVRELARGLRPPSLDALGFAQAVLDLLSDFERRTGIGVEARIEPRIGLRLPRGADIHVYRILQESLQNVLKHSKASKVRVTGRESGDRLLFHVRDNGVGMSLPAASTTLGTQGMKERASLLGGKINFESSQGVTVSWEVPLEHSHRR